MEVPLSKARISNYEIEITVSFHSVLRSFFVNLFLFAELDNSRPSYNRIYGVLCIFCIFNHVYGEKHFCHGRIAFPTYISNLFSFLDPCSIQANYGYVIYSCIFSLQLNFSLIYYLLLCYYRQLVSIESFSFYLSTGKLGTYNIRVARII